MNDEDIPPAIKVVGFAGVAVAVVLSTWMTIIAFVGGTMPIIGWETDGGIVVGLLWLFFVDPIVIAAGYWLTMLAVLPIALISGRR